MLEIEAIDPERKVIDLDAIMPPCEHQKIAIKYLVVDEKYQRKLSMVQVMKIVNNFDPFQVNPIKVNRRDGINYVFDGQHTKEALAILTNSRETHVPCMVFFDLDLKGEARVFAEQKNYVRNLTAFDLFKSGVIAEKNELLVIKSLLDGYKLAVGSAGKDGCISAISSLLYIHSKFGFEVLERTLKLCISTWGGDPLALVSQTLRGVALMLAGYNAEIDGKDFIEKLSGKTPKAICGRAKDRGGGALGFALELLDSYSKKINLADARNRLRKESVRKPPKDPVLSDGD